MNYRMLMNQPENLATRRILECLAIGMIGDGVLTFLRPQRHTALWRTGSRSAWGETMEYFAAHPEATRWFGAAEAVAGLWLATRQEADNGWM